MLTRTFCFKCGDWTVPVETHPNKTLGLCPCYEGWYVGTKLQMCDYLNEVAPDLLEEYIPEGEEEEDTDEDDWYETD